METGISKSEVSRICADSTRSSAIRTRIANIEFPWLPASTPHISTCNGTGQVVSMAVIVASGIAADGSHASILGLDVGDSEMRPSMRLDPPSGAARWRPVEISDQHAGLVKALEALFPGRWASALSGALRAQSARPRAHDAPTWSAHVSNDFLAPDAEAARDPGGGP